MSTVSSQLSQPRGRTTRAFIYALLLAFNALLWLLLIAFQFEVSLRAREVEYFDRQLFPLGVHPLPLPFIYAACGILSAASVGVILRDRSNVSAREKLQALLAQILESLDIGVVVLDQRGMLSLANESAAKLLPVGSDPQNGTEVQFQDRLQEYPQVREILRATFDDGRFIKEVEQDLGPAGNARTARISTLPLKNRQQKITGTLLLVNDVSEMAALERQIREAERLSAMGTLAATLAHEIRNPLEAISLNLELLARNLARTPATDEVCDRNRKYVRILESELARLTGIVENFLSFARPTRTTAESIRLDKLLHQVVELIENQATSRNIETKLNIQGGDLLVVRGYEDQLKQLFLNVVINGLEAMPTGGRLSIEAETTGLSQGDSVPAGAVVRIRDTGEGIAPETLGRLMEPFFTTRARGTGLGLTIANRVAREHGGGIRVESTPQQGSVFIIELPLSSTQGGP